MSNENRYLEKIASTAFGRYVVKSVSDLAERSGTLGKFNTATGKLNTSKDYYTAIKNLDNAGGPPNKVGTGFLHKAILSGKKGFPDAANKEDLLASRLKLRQEHPRMGAKRVIRSTREN
jgi:hypothetical protein